jgi:hypothetical protein
MKRENGENASKAAFSSGEESLRKSIGLRIGVSRPVDSVWAERHESNQPSNNHYKEF